MGKRASLIRQFDVETRRAVIERDGGMCVVTGRPAQDVHEVCPRSHFGVKNLHQCFDMRNRCCLSREIHQQVHTRQGRMALLRLLHERHGYDYTVPPWAQYMVDELDG